MKYFGLVLFLCLSGVGPFSLATSYAPPAFSLEEQLDKADLIVKGKVRKIGVSKPFFGYDENGNHYSLEERAEQSGIPLPVLKQLAFPLVEVEIAIDEVLYGTPDGPIILRLGLPHLSARFDETRNADRLFFLSINPDNKTYGSYYTSSILENVDGEYRYLTIPGPEGHFVLAKPDFVTGDDLQVEVFDQLVRDRIEMGQ